jgi:hypothetical protein
MWYGMLNTLGIFDLSTLTDAENVNYIRKKHYFWFGEVGMACILAGSIAVPAGIWFAGQTEISLAFIGAATNDICLEDIEGKALSDTQALQLIKKVLQNSPKGTLMEMTKADRNELVRQLKLIEGLSIRQISRLTGVSFNIVKRA